MLEFRNEHSLIYPGCKMPHKYRLVSFLVAIQIMYAPSFHTKWYVPVSTREEIFVWGNCHWVISMINCKWNIRRMNVNHKSRKEIDEMVDTTLNGSWSWSLLGTHSLMLQHVHLPVPGYRTPRRSWMTVQGHSVRRGHIRMLCRTTLTVKFNTTMPRYSFDKAMGLHLVSIMSEFKHNLNWKRINWLTSEKISKSPNSKPVSQLLLTNNIL